MNEGRHELRNQEFAEQHALFDPVCGMAVDQDYTACHYVYAGITHFFCSERCLTVFTKDPGNFFGREFPVSRSARHGKPLLGRPYTCPKHRGTIQDYPGTCFQCGESLVLMPPFT
jgi:P-type Cu+ transporter